MISIKQIGWVRNSALVSQPCPSGYLTGGYAAELLPTSISNGLKYIIANAISIPMKDTDGLIAIGTFSVITRLTKRALRLYDEKGLLSPARKEITGSRQYSYRQIPRGMQLKRLADLGFGIQEMMEMMGVLDGFVNEDKLDTILKKRIEDVNAEMNRLEKIRGSLLNKSFWR